MPCLFSVYKTRKKRGSVKNGTALAEADFSFQAYGAYGKDRGDVGSPLVKFQQNVMPRFQEIHFLLTFVQSFLDFPY